MRNPHEVMVVVREVSAHEAYELALIGGMVGEDTDAPSPRIWYSNDAMTWTQASLEVSGENDGSMG